MGTYNSLILLSISIISATLFFANAANTISQGQSIKDGETLISSGKTFELGFFSPENSRSRYVGIWYNISLKTVVWVANRASPVLDKKGVFKIGEDGNLVIFNGNGSIIWSSNVNSSVFTSKNTRAILMDNGNLLLWKIDSVLAESSLLGSDTRKAYWQSFNFPTDTYLPGMKVIVNSTLGENKAFSSWKSENDPSIGKYRMGIDPNGSPQIVIWETTGSNSERKWRSGYWNGLIFLGLPNMTSNYLYGFKLSNDDETGNMYFTYTPNNSSHIINFRMGYDGFERQLKWNVSENDWSVMQFQPANECESYNKCGNFSTCFMKNGPICNCIYGFQPKDAESWVRGNWSSGCVRRTKLMSCDKNGSDIGGSEDGFLAVEGVKLPDFSEPLSAANGAECKERCLSTCSCRAYGYVGGIGCMIWNEDLVDVEQFSENGKTFYVRLARSELEGKNSTISDIEIAAIFVSSAVFIIMSIWLLKRSKAQIKACSNSCQKSIDILPYDMSKSKSKDSSKDFSGPDDVMVEGKLGNGPELPIFSFQYLSTATNNFSDVNRLGQGGFGPVYKGKFPGGQDIAVKRLSRKSGQGVDEFKNEIILIARLQHRNLVRLLGCCIEGEEKMLVYEYMPNKSLDRFLFDSTRQAQLDWPKRFAIIEGIARGLLYLHRDSRLRVIHRDLKASNILLDEDMNPKISDFGMARIFGGNQNEEANTVRVVGTYGYMSPEYAMDGLFSVKSDVYSFGVLLLEIISGRRNTSFRHTENPNLTRHAWELWSEEKATELIDTSIIDSCAREKVMRCIHVGMLCVQDLAAYRPTMSTVVLMLESENANLPKPKQSSITSSAGGSDDIDVWNEAHDVVSSNEITISIVTPR